jgi:hypothetical protein
MKKIVVTASLVVLFFPLAAWALTEADCQAQGADIHLSADGTRCTTAITITGGNTSGSGVSGTQSTVSAPTNTPCPNGGQLVNGACNLGYTPLEPIPGINTTSSGQTLNFPQLLNNLYNIVITIGALFSVLMLTLSGVRYMMSDIVTDKQRAKDRIEACIYALVLIAASYLILKTINPQLVLFTLNPGSATITSVQTSGVGTPTLQGYQNIQNTYEMIQNSSPGTSAFTPQQCASARSSLDSYQQQLQTYCASGCYSRDKTSSDQYKEILAEIRNYTYQVDNCSSNGL